MIRVNLMQNRGSSTRPAAGNAPSGGTATDFQLSGIGVSTTSVSLGRPVIVKLIVLIAFPLVLFYFEQYNLSILQNEARAAAAQLNDAQTLLASKEAEVAQSADLKEKAKELANKIEILKKLAATRLREIKSLDFIQTNLPEKVWLKELKFKTGSLMIRGMAVTDDDLTTFVRALEKNRSFTNVILLQAKEERGTQGSVKTFEVSCNVEAE